MKRTMKQTILMTVLLMLLIVAVAFGVSCTQKEDGDDLSTTAAEETTTVADNGETPEETTTAEEDGPTVLGEGETSFSFYVVHKSGETVYFTIYTDAETVGEALQEVSLIEGEDSEFGLYVKTVNGETLDYNEDGMYWSLYIGDTYAPTGADSTAIEEGKTYSFRAVRG